MGVRQGAGRRVREPEEAIEEGGGPTSSTRINEEEGGQSLRLDLYVVGLLEGNGLDLEGARVGPPAACRCC